MRAFRRLCACQSGGTAVEFAIVTMVLVFVLLGVIELGRGLNIRNQLSFAADFGARRILTDRQISDSALEGEIRSRFNAVGPGPDILTVTLGTETADGVAFRTISLGYPFLPLVPGITSGSLNLKVTRRTPMV